MLASCVFLCLCACVLVCVRIYTYARAKILTLGGIINCTPTSEVCTGPPRTPKTKMSHLEEECGEGRLIELHCERHVKKWGEPCHAALSNQEFAVLVRQHPQRIRTRTCIRTRACTKHTRARKCTHKTHASTSTSTSTRACTRARTPHTHAHTHTRTHTNTGVMLTFREASVPLPLRRFGNWRRQLHEHPQSTRCRDCLSNDDAASESGNSRNWHDIPI